MQYDTNGLYKYNREAKVTIKEGTEVGETYVPILDFFLQVQVLCNWFWSRIQLSLTNNCT